MKLVSLVRANFFLAAFLLAAISCSSPQPIDEHDAPLRVLFIGNSYTFYNDLPGLFAELVRSSGKEVEAEMAAEAGWTLADHAVSGETQKLLRSQDWDYVILQEQSIIPSLPMEREGRMYPAVNALDGIIQEIGAETVLLMTWGRREGFLEKGIPDFAAMQSQLHEGYNDIGVEVGAIVAPVGLAWQAAISHEADIDLWEYDGSHPSLKGSYLAANVLYAAISGRSPQDLAYTAGLQVETALFLQRIAIETVLGSR